jgi:hypothetical protein
VASQSGRQWLQEDCGVFSKVRVKVAASQGLHMVELGGEGRYQGVQPSCEEARSRAHMKRQVEKEYSE